MRRRASRGAGRRHTCRRPCALGCPGCSGLGSAWGGGARGVTASEGGSVPRADASASVVLSRRAAWTGQVVHGIARWAWQHLFSVYLRGRLLSVKFVFYFSIFSTVWMLLSTTRETSLCLLASLIKTYPMPRVQPVLTGVGTVGGPLHPAVVPSGFQGGKSEPTDPCPWGEGLSLGWELWPHMGNSGGSRRLHLRRHRGQGQGRKVCESLREGARRPESVCKQRVQVSKPVRLINYDTEMWN